MIAAIAGASTPTHVLDVDPDHDHHRVVISLAAQRTTLLEGVIAAVSAAVEHIDMRSNAACIRYRRRDACRVASRKSKCRTHVSWSRSWRGIWSELKARVVTMRKPLPPDIRTGARSATWGFETPPYSWRRLRRRSLRCGGNVLMRRCSPPKEICPLAARVAGGMRGARPST